MLKTEGVLGTDGLVKSVSVFLFATRGVVLGFKRSLRARPLWGEIVREIRDVQ